MNEPVILSTFRRVPWAIWKETHLKNIPGANKCGSPFLKEKRLEGLNRPVIKNQRKQF